MTEADGAFATETAGLVLLAPFLPRFFTTCDLITGDRFVDDATRLRGVGLLGRVADAHGAGSALERLLCGLPPSVEAAPSVDVAPAQTKLIKEMLTAVLQTWPAMETTSRENLRQVFLRRRGLVRVGDDRVELVMEPRPCDVLLDQIPWRTAITALPWMPVPLHFVRG